MGCASSTRTGSKEQKTIVRMENGARWRERRRLSYIKRRIYFGQKKGGRSFNPLLKEVKTNWKCVGYVLIISPGNGPDVYIIFYIIDFIHGRSKWVSIWSTRPSRNLSKDEMNRMRFVPCSGAAERGGIKTETEIHFFKIRPGKTWWRPNWKDERNSRSGDT